MMVPDQVEIPAIVADPSIETRLAEVERKVEYIYQHVARQAAQQLVPQLQAAAEQQLLAQLRAGAAQGSEEEG